MSLWDWLLAVKIYEELFDDGSDNSSQNSLPTHSNLM